MAFLRELNLEITLPAGAVGRKFDGDDHGLSHCMSAVDFIVELSDRVYFIELKDPDDATDEVRKLAFAESLESGTLGNNLKTKFRDTWIYEWAENRISKPVYYLILIAFERLTADDLSTRKKEIERLLPLQGPANQPWKQPFARGCAVFNLAAWNRTMSDMPIRRVT